MSEILTLPPKLPKSQNAEVGASKFCPGCGHGITLKALAKAIDELGIQQKTVFGCDIGCSLLAWNYMDLDTVQTHHGRTTPVIYGFTRAIRMQSVLHIWATAADWQLVPNTL